MIRNALEIPTELDISDELKRLCFHVKNIHRMRNASRVIPLAVFQLQHREDPERILKLTSLVGLVIKVERRHPNKRVSPFRRPVAFGHTHNYYRADFKGVFLSRHPGFLSPGWPYVKAPFSACLGNSEECFLPTSSPTSYFFLRKSQSVEATDGH